MPSAACGDLQPTSTIFTKWRLYLKRHFFSSTTFCAASASAAFTAAAMIALPVTCVERTGLRERAAEGVCVYARVRGGREREAGQLGRQSATELLEAGSEPAAGRGQAANVRAQRGLGGAAGGDSLAARHRLGDRKAEALGHDGGLLHHAVGLARERASK